MLDKGDVFATHYEILKTIQTTSSIGLYEIKDLDTGKELALKTSLDPNAQDINQRLKREFHFLRKTSHPNIVTVHDGGSQDGCFYIVEELVPGQPITRCITGYTDEVFEAVAQILDALGFLHGQELIHHDLKPDNIFYVKEKKRVKILDFGFAEEIYSSENIPKGSIGYVAPEIIKGIQASPRTDLYSFGVIFYELLTSKNPFFIDSKPESPFSGLKYQFTSQPPPPSSFNPTIPRKLDKLILQLLSLDPYFRPGSAAEVREQIDLIRGIPETGRAQKAKRTIFKDFNPQTLPFVGRTDILARFKSNLFNMLNPAPETAPASSGLIFRGETGIGKTRIFLEFRFLSQMEGVRVQLATASSGRSLYEMLAQLVDFNTPENPINKFAIYEELTRQMVKYAAKKKIPHVLIVDDLDNYAEFDIGLFRYLSFNSGRLKMLVIGGATNLPEVLKDVTTIEIPALSREESAHLVGYVLGKSTSTIADLIYEKSSGNPLILVEILKELVATGDTARVKDILVPGRARQVFAPIIEKLKDDELSLMEVFSLYQGSPSSQFLQIVFSDLTKNSDDERYFHALHSLKMRGLVRPGTDSNFSLANRIVAEMIVAGMGELKKKELHKIIAMKIEGFLPVDESVFNLAHHYAEANVRDKAFHYSRLAAEKARKLGNTLQAVKYLASALDHIPELAKHQERLELARKAGEWEFELGNFGQAEKYFSTALKIINENADKIADQETCLLSLYRSLGCIYQRMVDHKKAIDFFKNVKSLSANTKNTAEHGELLADWAYSLISLDEKKDATKLLDSARVLAEEQANKKLLAKIFYYYGIIASNELDFEKARHYTQQALDLYDASKNLQGVALMYYMLAEIEKDLNNVEAAIDYYEKGIKQQENISDVYGLFVSLTNSACLLNDVSQCAEAKNKLEKALIYGQSIGIEAWLANVYNNLHESYLNLADWQKALESSESALTIQNTYNDVEGSFITYNSTTHLMLLRGELNQAKESFKKTGEIINHLPDPNVTSVISYLNNQSRILLSENKIDKVRESVTQSLIKARRGGHRLLPEVYIIISQFYEQLQDYGRMLIYSQKALNRSRKKTKYYAIGLRQTAKALFFTGNMVDAFKNLEEAIKILKAIDHKFEVAITMRDLSYLKILAIEKGMKLGTLSLVQDLNHADRIFTELGAKMEQEQTEKLKNSIISSLLTRISAKTQTSYLSVFHQLSEIVNSMINEDDFAERALDLVISMTGAERGLLFLTGHEAKLRLASGRNIDRKTLNDARDIARSIIDATVSEAAPIISLDAANDERFRNRESVLLNNIRSILCVPLKTRDEILGTIYLDSRLTSNLFFEDDKEFIMATANLLASTMEKSRMFKRFMEESIVLEGKVLMDIGRPYIIGTSKTMKECYEKAASVAKTDTNVLLTGETGTGKDIIARMIHTKSKRRNNLFLSINCGVLPETLFESTLFGHRKGAYTGATSDRKGAFETATGGTIFLDEINSATPSIQTKLLEAIESKIIRRLARTCPGPWMFG